MENRTGATCTTDTMYSEEDIKAFFSMLHGSVLGDITLSNLKQFVNMRNKYGGNKQRH